MDNKNKIPTGIENIDKILKDGIDKDMIYLSAPFKGKSSFPLKYIQENLPLKIAVTKYEKFGDTVFPVTYFDNGIVVVDYPNKF